MGVVTGIVLYAIIWFMTLLVVLQTRVVSQDEAGERVRGTHGSAPANLDFGKRVLVTSGVAFAIWAVIAGVIVSGAVTIDDIDLFTRFGLGAPPPQE
jgi:predicted secreted protein